MAVVVKNTPCCNYNKGPLKLVRRAQTVQIWFIVPARLSGTMLSNMWYSFTLLMALSTWILTLAVFCVCSTSPFSICNMLGGHGWLRQPCASSALMPLSHRECIQSVHYPLNRPITGLSSIMGYLCFGRFRLSDGVAIRPSFCVDLQFICGLLSLV